MPTSTRIAVPTTGSGYVLVPAEPPAVDGQQELDDCDSVAELYDVEICLDRIDAKITWIVSQPGLPPLRSAVATGELGEARIVSVEQRSRLSAVREPA